MPSIPTSAPCSAPSAPLEHRRLFEVRRTDHVAHSVVGRAWDDLKEAFQDGMRLVVGNEGKASLDSVELLVDVFEYLVHDEVPTVFLKQFRDAADPSLACYQALIEAPSKVQIPLRQPDPGRLRADHPPLREPPHRGGTGPRGPRSTCPRRLAGGLRFRPGKSAIVR